MAAKETHQIVIVGGNFGGISLAHCLLRQTLPALVKLHPQFSYHVTLVSPNTHFFFKIASPRALTSPTSIPNDKIFKSINEAFQQYEAIIFDFVQGKAVAVKSDNKTVTVQPTSDAQPRELKYDSLVIAVGTTSTSPLWTIHDDHAKSSAAFKALHEALPKASTVLIAGAGPVGIETAGEIATAHKQTKVTLVAPGARLLDKFKPSLGAKAQRALEDLGVTVKLNTRLSEGITDPETRPIKLSDGSSEMPDVFIDATGPRIINTGWLPRAWLDSEDRVVMRDGFFRVKGDSADSSIYAIGDVVAGTNKTAIELDAMVPTAASSIAIDILKGLGGMPASTEGFLSSLNPFSKGSITTQTKYSPMKDTIVIPIGPNGGVGQVFGWGMPSFMVKKGKSENFLMELVEPMITGKKWQ